MSGLNDCAICQGKGVVNWSSRYASKSPMSGEIMIENISVCGVCHGHGGPLLSSPLRLDMSVEEYHEKFGG